MRPFVTIEKSLPFPKDPLDVNEITGTIYQVPCHDCPFVYIGQTKRDLKSRLSEHKRASQTSISKFFLNDCFEQTHFMSIAKILTISWTNKVYWINKICLANAGK